MIPSPQQRRPFLFWAISAVGVVYGGANAVVADGVPGIVIALVFMVLVVGLSALAAAMVPMRPRVIRSLCVMGALIGAGAALLGWSSGESPMWPAFVPVGLLYLSGVFFPRALGEPE